MENARKTSQTARPIGAAVGADDYGQAVDFAERAFARWQASGLVTPEQFEVIRHRFDLMRGAVTENVALPPDIDLASPCDCWRCGHGIGRSYSYCNRCGIPLGAGADTARYLNFVLKKLARSSELGLSDSQAAACSADLCARLVSLRAKSESSQLKGSALDNERLSRSPERSAETEKASHATVMPDAFSNGVNSDSTSNLLHRRTILHIMLDPQNIQWLLGCGGSLLVVGLVVWLASLGIFRNPLVVAVCMGAGTLGVMGGGFATIKFTRHALAGRAMTLLACLAMPLNLWFYKAHGLVALDGHLWVAALVCCVLYATAATLLEDAVFVYVLAAGVAMTGLLILADVHQLIEVASPSALLVLLGMIFLHAERAFAVGDGPFSRKRFGMACFWSAHALLGAGLLFLLGAQVGSLFGTHVSAWAPSTAAWMPEHSIIVTDPNQRLLAIALVIAGAYAYFYSDLVVRRAGVYIYLAAASLLWAEALVIDVAHLTAEPCAFISAIAVTSLAINIMQFVGSSRRTLDSSRNLSRPLATLGMLLAAPPLCIGVLLYLRAMCLDSHNAWPYAMTWSYPGSMLVIAICCCISAGLNKQAPSRRRIAYLVGMATATLVGAAACFSLLGFMTCAVQADFLMVIPAAYLLTSRIYKDHPLQRPLMAIGQAATAVLIVAVGCSAFRLLSPEQLVDDHHLNLQLAAFCAEAAIFYAAAAVLYGTEANVYLATAMGAAAMWQLFGVADISSDYFSLVFAAAGILLLLTCRLTGWEQTDGPRTALAVFRSANLLTSISLVSFGLMAMARFAADRTDWTLAILLGCITILGLMSAGVVRQPGIRRWYFSTTVFECLLTFIALERQSQLNLWQKTECFSVAVGLILLAIGYMLWFREQDRPRDGTGACLAFGSILAGIPLAIAAIIYRFGFDISLGNEFALATVSILMFVSGFMCRLRAPTLIGGSLLTIHLSMLLISVGMRAQLAVGIYLAAGGAVLFGLGILLSIHRDRLLTLPQRIKEHEGVFRVLAWR